MKLASIVVCAFALSCKREEDVQPATITTSSIAVAPTNGPTQLVALAQPADSVAAPAETLSPTQTQTPTPTPSARVSSVVVGVVTANGLPSESVARVFRQNIPRFRSCNPAQARGRVIARITIDERGSIASAEDGGSDIADAVTSCVFGMLGTLAFPAPEAGSASATVPIVFSPPS